MLVWALGEDMDPVELDLVVLDQVELVQVVMDQVEELDRAE